MVYGHDEACLGRDQALKKKHKECAILFLLLLLLLLFYVSQQSKPGFVGEALLAARPIPSPPSRRRAWRLAFTGGYGRRRASCFVRSFMDSKLLGNVRDGPQGGNRSVLFQ